MYLILNGFLFTHEVLIYDFTSSNEIILMLIKQIRKLAGNYLFHYRYGQLSGMVEPIFGVLGAIAVSVARPVLPYALAFAAGAMIYVVVDDIIPEANTRYVFFYYLRLFMRVISYYLFTSLP